MRINYKILWIDDAPEDLEIQINKIKEIIKSNYLICNGLDDGENYNSYEDFERKMLRSFNKSKFVDCDLIMIDFNISEEQNASKNGSTIIKELRSRGVYTDVLFYSGNMFELKKSLTMEDMDGITYSSNEMTSLTNKFSKILEKQINLKYDISEIRGYLMDCTSDFDFSIKNKVDSYYETLNDNDKNDIKCFVKECVEKQKKLENKKFLDISKNYDKDKLILLSMDSQEYVMSVKDKMTLFSKILNKIEAFKYLDIDFETLPELYNKQIIQNRNKLAHSKLKYGKSDASHIKIAKSIEDLDCNCGNCSLEKRFSKEEISDIRRYIYEFYILFEKIDKTTK